MVVICCVSAKQLKIWTRFFDPTVFIFAPFESSSFFVSARSELHVRHYSDAGKIKECGKLPGRIKRVLCFLRERVSFYPVFNLLRLANVSFRDRYKAGFRADLT